MMTRPDDGSAMVNWVTTRYTCTATEALVRLADEAVQSVATRCQQIQADRIQMESPSMNGPDGGESFTVLCGITQWKKEASVRFRQVDIRTIRVDGSMTDEFDIHVDMNDNGYCVLSVNGAIREPWQVVRQALDRILFPNR